MFIREGRNHCDINNMPFSCVIGILLVYCCVRNPLQA